MNDNHRFGEDEVRRIFEKAGSHDGARRTSGHGSEGLTLAELQVIGEEVGLSPARIADAAATLILQSGTEGRNRLGMPVSVSRTMPLSRLPTDYEWELLLTDLRATFGVHGEDRSKGNIREWTHGTLFAFIEPAENGCRIRLGSSKPGASIVIGAGFTLILAGVLTFVTLLGTRDLVGANAFLPWIPGAGGVTMLLHHGGRLRRWARTCAAQMDHILGSARVVLAGEPKTILPSSTRGDQQASSYSGPLSNRNNR